MDGRAYDLAAHLLDCACVRLGDTCPTRHCVVPGAQPSFENCCEGPRGGQLTVNITRRYPSRSFPVPDLGVPNNCNLPYLITVYAVTILRCSPVGSAHHSPSCEELDKAAQQTMLDLERVWDGIACCLNDDESVGLLLGSTDYRWAFGNQTSVGPEGTCAGSTVEVLVGYPPCLECP